MPTRGLIVLSESMDPYLNMGIEQWLYETLTPELAILFLWKNSDSIIIGRFQNPWIECAVPEAEKAGIPVLRRISGGGTVFHDKGNLNFSIITPRGLYDQRRSFSVILTALTGLGFQAEIRNKSDIVIDGKKVSGNAFKIGSDRAMHHGTLLVNSDLPKLKRFLTPCIIPVVSKAIKSRPSPVVNLSEGVGDLSVNDLVSGLKDSFAAVYAVEGGEYSEFQEVDLAHMKNISAAAVRFKSWAWVFGKTPEFTFNSSGLEVTVESGIIARIENDKGAAVYPELLNRHFNTEDFFQGIDDK